MDDLPKVTSTTGDRQEQTLLCRLQSQTLFTTVHTYLGSSARTLGVCVGGWGIALVIVFYNVLII